MPCVIIRVRHDGDKVFTSRLDYHQAAARIADCISNKFGEHGEFGSVQERDPEIGFLAVVATSRATGDIQDQAYVLDWTYENIRFALRQMMDPCSRAEEIIDDADVLEND